MKKLLNAIQAAEILGLKPNTLEIWRCHEKGPKYIRMGRRILYDPDDLAAFASACTVEPVRMPEWVDAREDATHE